MKSLKKFYEGGYAKYILPGVLLQSVLIGGGYATGREIYSYGAKFGAFGWISGLTIGIGFALFAFLTFEICRIYKVYDYKNYIKQVIGPLWPVMDVLTILIAIMLIAVMAAATGSIFEQVGLPNFLGAVVIVFLCGLLNFKGSKVIEKFESVGTVLLYGGYILFTIIVLISKGSNIPQVLHPRTPALMTARSPWVCAFGQESCMWRIILTPSPWGCFPSPDRPNGRKPLFPV